MRIGVDGRSLASGEGLRQRRGLGRYLEAMLAELAAAHPCDQWRVLVDRDAAVPAAPNLEPVSPRAAGRLARATSAGLGRPRLDRQLGGEVDVVWLPAPAPVAVSSEVPYVLTVHDLSFELRPRDFGAYERLWARAARPARLARRAAAVLAVSDDTRAAAIEHWGLPPARVVTARSGVPRPAESGERPRDVLARHGIEPGYFLYVGALEPRKAPGLLGEAHVLARERGLRSALVVAGEGPSAGELRVPGARLLGRVPDADLAALYAGARATVLPSHLEGFGFTPLESLSAGTPAIVSDLPVFAETLGDGALRFPPGDAGALAEALLSLERDDSLGDRLVEAGREAAARLSWAEAARVTREALVRASGSRP